MSNGNTAIIRAVLVDDTRLARSELRTLLSSHSDVEIVGEADDVGSGLEAVRRLQPDLVLLDIQMPSGTGFDLLDALDAAPLVVFTTAYDEHAVRAFEANALDYLVKPVAPARLAAALERVRDRRAAAATAGPADASAPERALLGSHDQVFLREGERCWFVTLGEVDRIVVEGNYARLWFGGEKVFLQRSLSALEQRIEPGLFFRANRNTLVNLRAIRTIDPWLNDGYLLRLRDGSEVEVSRRQARELRERLSL